ncbi:MAG: host-nuclease inhibitor Gam family protein [Deltaproteobacteria bacterium]|jgi:phage host-nuclease inhibitor protein Gam|nr:host-nuclease inhibitor Gam family protein [Deltaproteobacteria bacterium]
MAKKANLIPSLVDNQAQAEGALAEMAALERKMIQADLDMRDICDAAKQKNVDAKKPLEARYKELETAIKKWATMNKSVLFAERKSLDLAFGVFGFKAVTAIRQMDGVSEAETLAKIKALGFADAIRLIEEVNREAMEGWTEERLALVGCIRRSSDRWHCKPKQEKAEAGA